MSAATLEVRGLTKDFPVRGGSVLRRQLLHAVDDHDPEDLSVTRPDDALSQREGLRRLDA